MYGENRNFFYEIRRTFFVIILFLCTEGASPPRRKTGFFCGPFVPQNTETVASALVLVMPVASVMTQRYVPVASRVMPFAQRMEV